MQENMQENMWNCMRPAHRQSSRPDRKPSRRRGVLGLIFCFLTVIGTKRANAEPTKASSRAFVVGYNEAWFKNNYGTGLTSAYDPEYVRKVFDDIKIAGGSVVRLFLFELRQGFVFQGDTAQLKGLEPRLLKNLKEVLGLARERGLKVYLTGLEGNEMRVAKGKVRDFYWNLLNFKYGEGDAYHQLVLGPLLDLMNANRDVIYAFDLMNEIQATVDASLYPFFSGFDLPTGWGARESGCAELPLLSSRAVLGSK
jgi:hypothetical protein